jgi:hypothetical protein
VLLDGCYVALLLLLWRSTVGVVLSITHSFRVSAFQIFLDNLGSLVADPWYAAYHHSHPTLQERLAAMDRYVRKSQ